MATEWFAADPLHVQHNHRRGVAVSSDQDQVDPVVYSQLLQKRRRKRTRRLAAAGVSLAIAFPIYQWITLPLVFGWWYHELSPGQTVGELMNYSSWQFQQYIAAAASLAFLLVGLLWVVGYAVYYFGSIGLARMRGLDNPFADKPYG
jgi:hypothetical protein